MKKTIAMFLTVSLCLCGLIAFAADKSVDPYAIKKDPKKLVVWNNFYDAIIDGKDIKDAYIELEAGLDDFRTKRIGKLVFLEETADAYIFKADPHTVGKVIFHKSSIKQIMENVEKRRQSTAKTAADKQAAGK